MNLWTTLNYRISRSREKIVNLFRTRAYLKHRLLNYIDVLTCYDSPITENDVMHVIDLELSEPHYIGQEVLDELLILELIKKDSDGFVTLTEAGRKRLFHRHFMKEHWSVFETKATTYGLILANVLLGATALYQAKQDTPEKAVQELRSIRHELQTINKTIQEEKTLIKQDTVYIHQNVVGKPIDDSAKHIK